MSTTSPMPNQLMSGSGEVLYSAPFASSVAETLADFRIHVENSATLSTRVPIYRALVREVDEVLTDPRVQAARHYAAVGQQADGLQVASSRAGRFAFLRPAQMERQHEIRWRRDKQLTLMGEIGTGEDPIALVRVAGELGVVKDRLVFRAMQLRTTQVLDEVNAQPRYLTELLGPRPENGNLRVMNAWQTAAEKIVGRCVDLGVTGDGQFDMSVEGDHVLVRAISSARQAVGLDIPERGVYAGIGF